MDLARESAEVKCNNAKSFDRTTSLDVELAELVLPDVRCAIIVRSLSVK